jgi:hypothetical protein
LLIGDEGQPHRLFIPLQVTAFLLAAMGEE